MNGDIFNQSTIDWNDLTRELPHVNRDGIRKIKNTIVVDYQGKILYQTEWRREWIHYPD